MPTPQLSKDEFTRRYSQQFVDPAFRAVQAEIDKIAEVAWDGYHAYRKAPVTAKAGAGFKNPDYDLSADWTDATTFEVVVYGQDPELFRKAFVEGDVAALRSEGREQQLA